MSEPTGRDGSIAALGEEVSAVTNRDIPLLKGTLRRLLGVESVDDLPAAARAVQGQLEAVEDRLSAVEARLDRLGDVGTEATTKEEKFAAVLAFAMNKRNGSSKVAVSPQEVKGCTGVSRRYAYDLIDAMGASIDGVEVREARTVPTGTGPERQGKALLVNCERVHELDGGVNRFNTRGGSTGGT